MIFFAIDGEIRILKSISVNIDIQIFYIQGDFIHFHARGVIIKEVKMWKNVLTQLHKLIWRFSQFLCRLPSILWTNWWM